MYVSETTMNVQKQFLWTSKNVSFVIFADKVHRLSNRQKIAHHNCRLTCKGTSPKAQSFQQCLKTARNLQHFAGSFGLFVGSSCSADKKRLT